MFKVRKTNSLMKRLMSQEEDCSLSHLKDPRFHGDPVPSQPVWLQLI